MTARFVLVTLEDSSVRVPNVLEDYIYSLNMISDVIHIGQLTVERLTQTTDIFILTQMWLDLNSLSTEIVRSGRMIYLNVEMLSEIKRMDQVVSLIKSGIRVADYSLSNLTFLLI